MVKVAEVKAKELHGTERKYVKGLDATLNTQVPTTTGSNTMMTTGTRLW